MKLRILLTLATTALFAGSLFAQPGSIEHAPAGCMLEGEMAIMSVETADNGLLRAYFRRQGSTDWCFVDGQNRGKASTVTLPKFDPNEQIEYYFVVIDRTSRHHDHAGMPAAGNQPDIERYERRLRGQYRDR